MRPPRAAARHAAEAGAVRLRRALRLHPRLRARAAGRDRDAGAEVGQEEAEAAVVRRGGRTGRTSTRAPRLLGVELDEHIAIVVGALRPIAARARPARYGLRERRLRRSGRRRSSTSRTRHAAAPARDVAHDDAPLVEARDRARRVARDAEGDQRPHAGRGHYLVPFGEQPAAARGRLESALEAPLRRGLEGGRRPASDAGGVQPGSKRRAPGRGGELALRLVAFLREVAGAARPSDSGSATASPPVESGPHSHFWRENA